MAEKPTTTQDLPVIEFEVGEVTFVSIRSEVEKADDALTQAILSAQALSEHTDPIAVAQAMRDAELATAVAGKAKLVAHLLVESVTPPVVG